MTMFEELCFQLICSVRIVYFLCSSSFYVKLCGYNCHCVNIITQNVQFKRMVGMNWMDFSDNSDSLTDNESIYCQCKKRWNPVGEINQIIRTMKFSRSIILQIKPDQMFTARSDGVWMLD